MGCHPDEAKKRAAHRNAFTNHLMTTMAKGMDDLQEMQRSTTTTGSELLTVTWEGVKYNLTITRDRAQ